MRARLVTSLVLLASFFPSGPVTARAADAPAGSGDTLTVSAGWGGVGLPGAAIPVRARISAERLFAGRLEVVVGGAGLSDAGRFSLPVEVPGGSVKEYVVAVPTPPVSPIDVAVRLRTASGATAALEQLTVEGPRDEELVGLLPGVLGGAAPPGSSPLAVDAGVARFFVLDEALLGQAPVSLESLSTIGMHASGLQDLAPAVRTGVLAWVEAGGRLLVDMPAGTPVPGLPQGWQPDATGRMGAGRGEVVATGGAMAAGRWSGLVEPTPRGETVDAGISPGQQVSQALAVDAGLAARGAGWLTGFLLLYLLVAGPVTFLVLRRKRREQLAWVAIPVVAVLFATGSYVEGRKLRAADASHASVILSGSPEAGGPRAVSFVGVIARKDETVRVGFPAAWKVRIGSSGASGVDTAAVSVGMGRSDPLAEMTLNSGQMGVALASGPVNAGTGLAVAATVRDGRLSGTVANGTPFRAERVAVVVGTRSVAVGSIGPGEERSWSLEGTALLPLGDPLVPALWPGQAAGYEDGTAASYNLWQVVVVALGAGHPAPGTALAVGWTRDYRPEFLVNGERQAPRGRTMLLDAARVGYQSGPVPALAAARRLVRGTDAVPAGFPDGGPSGPAVARFDVPPGASPASLSLRTLFGSQVDVWRDGAWRSVDYSTFRPVDDSDLRGDFVPEDGAVERVPPPVPPVPPRVIDDVGVPKFRGMVPVPFPIGGGMLVDFTLGSPSPGPLYVRVQNVDGSLAGAHTWVWERQA